MSFIFSVSKINFAEIITIKFEKFNEWKQIFLLLKNNHTILILLIHLYNNFIHNHNIDIVILILNFI